MPNPTVYLSHDEWEHVSEKAESDDYDNRSQVLRELVQSDMGGSDE